MRFADKLKIKHLINVDTPETYNDQDYPRTKKFKFAVFMIGVLLGIFVLTIIVFGVIVAVIVNIE